MVKIRGTLVLFCFVSVVLASAPARPAGAHTPHDSAGDLALSPEFAEDMTLMVITQGRLMRSEDAGSSWHPVVNGLPTAKLRGVTFAGPTLDAAYVTADDGIYVSRDGGDTWESAPIAEGLQPRQISASPVEPDHAAVLTLTGAVWVTTDGGDTWMKSEVESASSLSYASGSTELLVVTLRNGDLMTTEDTSGSWERIPTPAESGASAVSAQAPEGVPAQMFIGTAEGALYRSDDGGSSFTAIDEGLPNEAVRSVIIHVGDGGGERLWVSMNDTGVWSTGDGGNSWERRSVGLSSDRQAVSLDVSQFRKLALAASETGERILFLSGFDGMFRSDDDGQLWHSQETLGEMITGLSVSPDFMNDQSIVLSTYVKGAYRSDDGGESWTFIADDLRMEQLESGNEYLPVRRLHDVVHSPAYETDRTLFSATWTRLLRSTDRGGSWTTEFVSDPPSDDQLRGFKIAVSPDFDSDATLFLGTRQGEIFRSAERGDGSSFERLGTVDGEVRMIVLSPDFPEDRTMFLGAHSGVHRSDDGGETWTQTGPTSTSLLSISPEFARDGTVFAASGEEGLWVTRDAGESWEHLTEPISADSRVEGVAVSPSFATDGTVLVSVRSEGLFRSQDGGETWVEVGEGLAESNILLTDFITNPSSSPLHFSPDFAADRTIFGFGDNRLMVSRDAGESWSPLPVPDSQDFPFVEGFEFPEPSNPELHRDVAFPPEADAGTAGAGDDDGLGVWVIIVPTLAVIAASVVVLLRRTDSGDSEDSDHSDHSHAGV